MYVKDICISICKHIYFTLHAHPAQKRIFISSREKKLCTKTLVNEDEFQQLTLFSHWFFFCEVLQADVTTPCSVLLQTMCILWTLSRCKEHVWLAFLAIEPKDLLDLVSEKKKSERFVRSSA